MVNVRLVVVGIENTAQNNDSSARDTLIQLTSLHNGSRFPGIELNLVRKICVPRSILGEYHPYHAKLYLLYIGN